MISGSLVFLCGISVPSITNGAAQQCRFALRYRAKGLPGRLNLATVAAK
jgi:hypothetical protein